jgi:hypothetical protein
MASMKSILACILVLFGAGAYAGPLVVSNEDAGLTTLVDPWNMKFLGFLPEVKTKAVNLDLSDVTRWYPDIVALQNPMGPPPDWKIPDGVPELSSDLAIAWDNDSFLLASLSNGRAKIGRYDSKSGKLLAELSIIGRPKSILVTETRIFVSAEIPEAHPTGILYALDPSLSSIQNQMPLEGHPWAMILTQTQAEKDAASFTATPSPTPSVAASPTMTPGISLPPPPQSAFKASLHGQLQDATTQMPLALTLTATIFAENSRGRRFPAKVQGSSYLIEGLPWGSYSVSVEAPGYQSLVYPRVTLLGKKLKTLDLELEPLPTPQK